MVKKIFILLALILISGLSGIVFDRYLFPYLATTKLFSKYDFLKRSAEEVTVINKTEQVYIKEDSSQDKIANQVSSSIVNVISYNDSEIKAATKNTPSNSYKNGTGMIVTSDGLIMTYASAINPENSKYKVITSEGNFYDAQLEGIDSWSNLAFVKISASNLSAISIGNSNDVKSGQKIIAVGNNHSDYQNQFASGQIIAFNPAFNLSGKTLSMSDKLEGIFETSADLDKDYVGGPLVDYSGQVIGVMGSIDRDGTAELFGIPSNKVKLVIDRAINKEFDKNYQLGVYYIPISRAYATANNIPENQGALIYSPSGQQGLAIIAGSPAARTDLKINDIIIQVGEENISSKESFPDLLYKHKKGEEIELTVIRDKNQLKVKVQL
jgi:S1-C subfamily serine protease